MGFHRFRSLVPSLLVLLAALLAAPRALAGGGAGELSLDRGVVAALVDLRLAELVRPGTPAAVAGIRLARAGGVDFQDGAIVVPVRVSAPSIGLGTVLRVRYRPEVDRPRGTVRFVPFVLGGGALPVNPSSLLPVISLPRLLEQEIPGGPTGRARLTLAVQGAEVREDRVVLRFGVTTRPAPPPGGGR